MFSLSLIGRKLKSHLSGALAALGVFASFAAVTAYAGENWPQAAGPNSNWSSKASDAPISWSVARNQNIAWRTILPETGQSGIAVWGDRLFLTTMKPLVENPARRTGSEIVGYCLDALSGKILWSVELPGSVESEYAYGYSDSSSPTPISDGKHVWFYNASGSVGCWDFEGKQVWMRLWKPTFGRPFNKQFEPFLEGTTLLNMEPRDEADPKREKDPWNYVRGLDKNTGATLWVSEDALTHYNTPGVGALADGTRVLLQGRGGRHGVPENPVGLSLTSLAPGHEGQTLWRYEGTGYCLYNMQVDKKYAYWLNESDIHQVIDIQTGKLIKSQSLSEKVDWRSFDPATGNYVLHADVNLKSSESPYTVFPAWNTNIAVEGYQYFLCFTDRKNGPPHCVGRVNIETDKVEYLELPVQVLREAGKPDALIWGEPQTSSTLNSRGIDAANDKRSKRDGWWWCMLGNPTIFGGKIYYTNMLGVTYVIDAKAKVLDGKALLAVNDLGAAGETWSLNSISYANSRLYHRSMKEVVCIGGAGGSLATDAKPVVPAK